MFVVCGGVLVDSNSSIGENGVIIPKSYYKILLVEDGGKYEAIGFLMPNENSKLDLSIFRRAD